MVSPLLNCMSNTKRSSVSSINNYSNGDNVGQSLVTVTMDVYTLSLLSDITRNHHLQLKRKTRSGEKKEGNPLD